MKWAIQLIATVAFVVVPLVHAQGSGELLDVLRANGFAEYATFLETRSPLTLAKLEGRRDIVIWAPVNNVATPDQPPRRRRRDAAGEAFAAYQMSSDEPPPPAKAKRQEEPLPDTNFEVRRTFLNEPDLVNLGGEHLNIVTNYASPQSPDDVGSDIEITTGLGRIVNATSEPIKFNRGIIYGCDSFFTFPRLLSETLDDAGAASFLAAIEAEELGDRLDTTPRITVFAPLSQLATGQTAGEQVVFDFLGYTPRLVPGATYGNVTITKVDGIFFANGRRIVKSDVPIKNGVLHYVDDVGGSESPTATPTGSTPTPTSSAPTNGTSTTGVPASPEVFTGASASLRGSWVIGAVGAGFGLWMAI